MKSGALIMNRYGLSLSLLVIAAACNGTLTVTPIGDPNAAGTGGHDSGVAGHSPGVGGSGAGEGGLTGEAGSAEIGGRVGIGGSTPSAGGSANTGGSGSVGGWGSVGGSGSVGGWVTSGGSGSVGGWVTSGGSGPGPNPGLLGAPCIPGGTVVEADGTAAKAQVRTLPRCAPGLSCATDNTCQITPDCPQSGKACVVRHAAFGGNGAGGGAGYDLGYGGGADSGGSGPFSSGGGGPVYHASERSGVTAITASESRVYWVEYGTRDALGNYQHDGSVLEYSPSDGTTSVIASGLEGPTAVEVTTTHAYIYVDGARPLYTPIHAQLLRVPLTGGTPEVVQEGALPAAFAAAGSKAFFSSESTQPSQNIYAMASDSGAVPVEFVPGSSYRLESDGTNLYYQSSNGLTRTPVTSAAPVPLGVSADNFVLSGDSIFATEGIAPGGVMLSRASKSGGEFLRVRPLGSGYPVRLRHAGSRFFVETSSYNSPSWHQVLTATLADEPAIRLVEPNRGWAGDRLWAATETAVYWSEGRAIYQQPIPTP